ncbi:hypothetical protein CEG14_25165 [Bordetella genomosp. 1]|uniref:Lipoprotein n=2 Tax=Bordetella genomosp. 1 TaxID=1395607 RepID=A0A261RTD8_9BORD|nr:hypothetical protein CEG14_25165 [Bordetella genomosp. 1]OZI69332.1 hypothetical protein CAL27_02155 [Bordetella genomosp. 1]
MFHMAFGRMALRIVATLAAAGLLAACGYRGPLYLPNDGTGKPGQGNASQRKPEPAINAPQNDTTTLPN